MQRSRNGPHPQWETPVSLLGVFKENGSECSPGDPQAPLMQDLGHMLDKALPESRIEDGRALTKLLQQLTGARPARRRARAAATPHPAIAPDLLSDARVPLCTQRTLLRAPTWPRWWQVPWRTQSVRDRRGATLYARAPPTASSPSAFDAPSLTASSPASLHRRSEAACRGPPLQACVARSRSLRQADPSRRG